MHERVHKGGPCFVHVQCKALSDSMYMMVLFIFQGWGTLSSGGSTASELMQAQVQLVSKERCLKSYPRRIHDSMLCAGYDEGGIDTCQGDSGGPLVCRYNGKWHVEGATSWGHRCATKGYFGVYANVRYLLNWIREMMATY